MFLSQTENNLFFLLETERKNVFIIVEGIITCCKSFEKMRTIDILLSETEEKGKLNDQHVWF